MFAYSVTSVVVPAGWTHSLEGDGFIRWYPTEVPWTVRDTPLTLGFYSTITSAATYTEPVVSENWQLLDGRTYPIGIAVGGLVDGEGNSTGGGGIFFSYVGPVIPEPSTTALLLTGATLLGHLLKKRRTQPSARPYGSPAAGSPSGQP